MDNYVTQQLVTEIQKLKDRDYTSYHNFYNQTAQYLYGVIFETVQDEEVANVLINDLYTDIYESIGTELTDNTQFYSWAENKARALSNTYVMTHALSGKKEDNKSKEAAVAMSAIASTMPGTATNAGTANLGGDAIVSGTMNAGMSQAASGNMNAGMSQAASGNMNAGMGRVASGNMNAGMGQVASENMNTAMGRSASGNMSAGMSQDTIRNTGSQMANRATGSLTNAGGRGASTVAKTGMSIVSKLAICVASAVVIVCVSILVIVNTKKHKDDDLVTTESAIAIEDTDETAQVETANVTEEEVTEEEVTEEEIDPEAAERAAAYYELIVAEDGSMPIDEYYSPSSYDNDYDPNAINDKFKYSDIMLVDFRGDGKKQLVTVTDGYTDTYDTNKYVRVYDFIDGGAKCIFEVDYSNDEYNSTASNIVRSRVYLITAPDAQVSIEVADPDEGGSVVDYVYDNGSMVAVNTSEFDYNLGYQTINPGEGYLVECIADDGGSPTGATFYNITDVRNAALLKMKYDAVIEELTIQAGIDTSNVWKSVYAKKIQQLNENFYCYDYTGTQSEGAGYNYALQDMNGDGVPELIGMFHGFDTGRSFAITCSKYGTYDYISLTSGNNYFDAENGRLHTLYIDSFGYEQGESKITDSRLYAIDKGCFIMVGEYEQYYPRMSDELVEEYHWWDYDTDVDSETSSSVLAVISAEEFDMKAKAFVPEKDFESIFSYVTTPEEITSAIENY